MGADDLIQSTFRELTYTHLAVKVYRVPASDPNWRTFRIVAWGVVAFLVVVLAVSIYEPMELGDPARRTLAWIAGAIVLSSVVLAMVLAQRGGLRKFRESFRFELSDSKIIQTHEEQEAVEMPLAQIESLHENRNWLVVRGGEPAKQITIPSQVNDFAELKLELAAYRPVTALKSRISLVNLFAFALLIVACLYFVTSNRRAIVITAGSAVLILQGLGLYSISRYRRSVPERKLLALMWALIWLLTIWTVYQRSKGTM